MGLRSTLVFCLVCAAAQGAGAQTPTGEGAPAAVSCRPPQLLPGSRLKGPKICKTNAVWAQYRRDGMDVAPDGVHDVPGEKYHSTHPLSCRPATAGGSGTSNMNQFNFGMVCE